jgi:Helix-turn-helix domain
VAEQRREQRPGKQWPGEQLSRREFEFLQRWRELVDKVGGDGGQKRVASRLKWSTSTVSRDYAGITLPSDERLEELCDYLRLPGSARVELAVLLRQARDAQHARRKINSAPSAQTSTLVPGSEGFILAQGAAATMVQEDAAPHREGAASPGAGLAQPARRWLPHGPWVAAAVAAVAAVTAAVLVWHPWDRAQTDVVGTYPGEGLQPVAIPVKSLTPSLVAAFRQGRTAGAVTVTGYEFRNARDDSLCLTAVDTGPTAGEDRDRVEIATCRLTPSQIWIPEQWEINGSKFTHLVSDKYQSKCLNARNIGGLGNGHHVQLWKCYYPANNESWDFGDWYQNVKPGVHSYPILLHTDRLCLDADKDDFRDGAVVNIWTQYRAANQFWS